MTTIVLKCYVENATKRNIMESRDDRTNEQVIFDAIENAFGDESAFGRIRHLGDGESCGSSEAVYDGEWPCYFTLLASAKITMLVAMHFAPCTQPEIQCQEIIDLITKAQHGG